MKTVIPALLLIALLSGCASEEYRISKSQCEPQAFSLWPVSLQKKVINKERTEERSTGKSRCRFGLMDTMDCEDETRLVSVPYQEIVTVDVNRRQRFSFIRDCAMKSCVEQYGAGDRCKSGFPLEILSSD